MFVNRLNQRLQTHHTQLCIGLDPDVNFIHDKLNMSVLEFNKAVIDVTHDLVLCYKPQVAHYSAFALEHDLAETIHYIHSKDLTVILDSKRGDVGSTATYYAKEAFERYRADAVTVNPYLGFDSIEPFLKYKDKGVIILARTSNPSAGWLQSQLINNKPLYLALAEYLDAQAQHDENILFVMGAADTDAIKTMRTTFPQRWFLVPGIGAQGGDLDKTLLAGGKQLIINVGRAIISPDWDKEEDYFALVRKSAVNFHKAMMKDEV